jgi:preprotein translocase subunit YajC
LQRGGIERKVTLVDVLSVSLLAQQEGADGGLPWFLQGPWIPFLVIGLMFYLLLLRPERRKRAQAADVLGNLKKNDHVVTVGGIHGVVVNAAKDSEVITIRVDENNNTRLRVLRTAIDPSRVVRTDDAESSQDAD